MKALVIVNGFDKVGIVHAVTGILMDYNVNIEDISQTIMDGNIFVMSMLVDGEDLASSFHELSEKLTQTGKEIGVDIRIQRTDVFHAMHNI